MPYESAELVALYGIYTASPDSIGAHLGQAAARASLAHPLIVATGSDIVLYPGDGASPMVQGFRLSSRGFKELAAVSHLGPALATIAMLRDLDESGGWADDAERLLIATRQA
ncbi:MAG: DUF5624 domain-containing protein, partial [Actinomycetota bacterium]|nr:DUF5624 domain-containing protein [Actinomycetota bacterium]